MNISKTHRPAVTGVKDIWTFEVKQTRTIITLTDVLTAEAL